MRYYQLRDDLTIQARWHLGAPRLRQGPVLDPRLFTQGAPQDVPGALELSIRERGRALDFTLADFEMPVLTPELAACIEGLAPESLQRLPVAVDGVARAYEIVNVTTTLDYLDETTSELMRWGPQDGRPERIDEYRMVSEPVLVSSRLSGRHFFRLGGWKIMLLASEALVQRLKQVPHEGFTPVEVRLSASAASA